MRLVFLGPPGAGKGTLAGMASKRYGIPKISTGDIFREAVKADTELGQTVKSIMERGQLVPDNLTVDLVRTRLKESDAKSGFILDGFPRTVPQAEALAAFQDIDAVIDLRISEEAIIRRLSGRRVCRSCAAIYHVTNAPPRKENACDVCGGQLYQRDDDTSESIKQRLKVYDEQTAPLAEFYCSRGLLLHVDSSQTPEASLHELGTALRESAESAANTGNGQ